MVKVLVQQGWLEGEERKVTTGDGHYFSFKGVPYAAPPTGKLRFKAPEPPLPWTGVRKATEHGLECPQFNVYMNKLVPGSEDCLYLNVYTPSLTSTSLPVMLYIHGGGFVCGSGNDDFYGPDFLVNHGVILVTINYRLEALGFLCLDTEDVPGNAGLKDQVAALRWVKNNIKQFGGDPEKVTVFGQSAGGASTIYHILSPMSKGLFKRAIPMSGAPTCDWCTSFESRKRAFKLGSKLGFDTDDPKELLEFLQSVEVDKLINPTCTVVANEDFLYTKLPFKMNYFNPVIETDFGQEYFIIEDVFEVTKAGKVNNVDIMIGYTSNEALFFNFHDLDAQFFENYKQTPELFVLRKIIYNISPKKALELSERKKKFYFGNKPVDEKSEKEFRAFASQAYFTSHVQRFIQLLPKTVNTNRYFYQFDMRSERNFFGNYKGGVPEDGCAHMDDCWYLFHANSLPMTIDKNTKGYQMVQTACKLFTNFAKYGNPTPDASLGLRWPTFEPQTWRYLRIAEAPSIENQLEADELAFWRSIWDSAGLQW